jgi:hypothetical protein
MGIFSPTLEDDPAVIELFDAITVYEGDSDDVKDRKKGESRGRIIAVRFSASSP